MNLSQDIQIILHLMEENIERLNLNLHGKSILTEAANGTYSFLPLLALKAGATKVTAICRNCEYGNIDDVRDQLRELAAGMGLDRLRMEIVERINVSNSVNIDIITNSGHVRPINRELIRKLGPNAVLSYMFEAWEFRNGDVDLHACREFGIPVAGLNEEHPLVDCFSSLGQLALRMIFESRVSLSGTRIAILSRDKFGREIFKTIKKFNPSVVWVQDWKALDSGDLENLDLLIVADYKHPDVIVGNKGILSPVNLKKLSPWVKVIQFCGSNDTVDLIAEGISVYPEEELPPHRLMYTRADLSYENLIRLFAGGLKVGEILHQAKQEKNFNRLDTELCQPIWLPHQPVFKPWEIV